MAKIPTTTGFNARLKEACARARIDHPGAWIAKNLSIAPATASQYLNDVVVPMPDKAWHLARILGVPFGWLYFGEGSIDAKPGQVRDQHPAYDAAVEVPVFHAAAGAGPGVSNHDAAKIGSIYFRPRSLERHQVRPEAASVFYVRGNSMLPRLRDGDAVLFDTTDTDPIDGKVYVVRWNGADYVKRLRYERSSWWLCSDNAADPEWSRQKQVTISPDDCRVLGRVRWVGSWED